MTDRASRLESSTAGAAVSEQRRRRDAGRRHVAFGALAERVASFKLTAEPERRLNSALRGRLARVAVRVEAN